MKRLVLNATLAAILLAIVAAGVILRPATGRPNLDFLPQMAHSPRYNAFSPDPSFADGATLQPPLPHTIARGFMPLPYAATPQDAIRAGEQLRNPIADSVRARARGERVFAAFCTPCHGDGATGNGIVAQRGYPPPPSLLAPHAVAMKDGQMYHVLTFGQNNMPSYSSQISRDDRWNVVVYLRTLQAQTRGSVRMPAGDLAQKAGAKPAGRPESGGAS